MAEKFVAHSLPTTNVAEQNQLFVLQTEVAQVSAPSRQHCTCARGEHNCIWSRCDRCHMCWSPTTFYIWLRYILYICGRCYMWSNQATFHLYCFTSRLHFSKPSLRAQEDFLITLRLSILQLQFGSHLVSTIRSSRLAISVFVHTQTWSAKS